MMNLHNRAPVAPRRSAIIRTPHSGRSVLKPVRATSSSSTATNYTSPSSITGGNELTFLQSASTVVPSVVLPTKEKGTAASVSFGLLKSIVSAETLGLKPLENAIAAARAYDPTDVARQVDKAFANVGAILAEQVSGRISVEIDPRLAHDTAGIVSKAKSLAQLFKELNVKPDRLLFRVPATWEGVCAAKELEGLGLSSHVSMVFSLVQGVAAAQAGASLIETNVGRTRDWYNKHPGVIRDPTGPRQDAGSGVGKAVDPGVQLATQLYNYIKVYHPRTKLMATGIRTREDALNLSGCDFLLLPPTVMDELRNTPTVAGYNDGLHVTATADDPLADMIALSQDGAVAAAPRQMDTVDKQVFDERLGVAGTELLAVYLQEALKDVEALAALNKATTGVSST